MLFWGWVSQASLFPNVIWEFYYIHCVYLPCLLQPKIYHSEGEWGLISKLTYVCQWRIFRQHIRQLALLKQKGNNDVCAIQQ